MHCCFHDGLSCRVKIIRKIFKQCNRVLLRNGQRTHWNIQAAEIFEQNVKRVILIFCKTVYQTHLFSGFGCDRDCQRNSRVAVVRIIVRIAVRNVNDLCFRRDLAHIPEYLAQKFHTLFVERENVHTVLCACHFGRKNGYDLTPVGRLPDNLDGCKISVLQTLQLSMIFTLNFRNGGCQQHGIFRLLLIRKEDAERRGQKCTCNNDDRKHDEKRSAAA